MNTCIKCGCQEAFPSLPPCPTPVACPNPQPCSEVFDAQCIVFTLPDILCGEIIVVAEDSSVAEALDGIVTYFCEQISIINQEIININIALGDTVQSVTGLNTDNTDPQNPIIRISVDGTTITGLGTPASPLIATGGGGGGIGGSGTTNYLARWTPDGTTLGNSVIRDDGSTIGIGTAPSAGQQIRSLTTTQATAYSITQGYSNVAGTAKGIEMTLSGNTLVSIGAQFGVRGGVNNIASLNSAGDNIFNFLSYVPANSNIGTVVQAQDSSSPYSYGLVSIVSLPSLGSGNHVGARLIVDNGVTNYGLQIEDGTEGVEKVLTCVTADGKANWNKVTSAYTTGASGSFTVGAQTITVTNGLITSIV